MCIDPGCNKLHATDQADISALVRRCERLQRENDILRKQVSHGEQVARRAYIAITSLTNEVAGYRRRA